MGGWDRISANFVEMSHWTSAQAGLTVAANSHRKELADYTNEAEAKTRLLSEKIGENPRAEVLERESTALWQAISELSYDLKVW